jgi:hypothetical protein
MSPVRPNWEMDTITSSPATVVPSAAVVGPFFPFAPAFS